MNRAKSVCWAILCVVVALVLSGAQACAQNTVVASRVTQAVDESHMVQLHGNVHPLARQANDRGALAESQPITRMMLVLQRSPEQEATLRQLLEDQQNRGSANFHAWMTPAQFGSQFGPSDGDVQVVTDWLTKQGFQVKKVAAGRTIIEFSGNVAQVQNAFHTQIHQFASNGEVHFANVNDPSIPEALTPVVAGVAGLHNFRSRSFAHQIGNFRRDLTTGQVTPLFTFNDVNGTFYAVGPADFATIYHIPGSADGTGQSIAVVGRSNILLQDVRDFRTMFGLAAKDPQIILNGPDPGLVSGDEGESDLDVEWAGAVAPAAQIIFVTTQNTQTDGVDGVLASALYAVDNNVAPIVSESYGSCEAHLAAGGLNTVYNSLWQQAAAQGITVVVAAGDNGAAGCDDPSTATTAIGGIAVSGIASTPYNIAMGGTDFNQVGNQTTYWNTNGTNNVYPSAKGYIPELPWNDSCAGGTGGVTACASATVASGTLNIAAGSGGPSSIYPKPTWQTGTGVPADGVRDLPDVSLFASDGGLKGLNASFYVICESDQNIPGSTGCDLTSRSPTTPFHDFQAVGGTSAATPTFAGIMALVNQKTGQRQGNANYALYRLATTAPSVFHDVTTGNNSVPCTGSLTNDCSTTSSTGIGVLTTTSGGTTLAYAAGTGYDLATGLGSVDVTNLLANWASPVFTGTTTTLTGPSPSTSTVDSSVTVSGTVTKTAGSGTPTGFVILENVATGAAIDTFALNASGAYSGPTAFLPGGSYSVRAHYGGDGTFGASDSNLTAVTVNPQGSKVIVSWLGSNGTPTQSSQSVPYGSPYILRVDVATGGGSLCQNLSTGVVGFVCPTGTITLFKNSGVPLNDFPPTNGGGPANVTKLNDRGFAEDQPIQLTVVGSPYSITATYSGDNSYNAQSSSNTLSVTINKAGTTTGVTSNLSTINAGANVILTATVTTQSNGEAPCGITNGGTIQFASNGTALPGTVSYTPVDGATSSNGAACIATLTTAISALYPPPAGGEPRPPRIPLIPILVALLSVLLFALGWRWMPEPRRRVYAYAGLVAFALLAVGIAGCGGGSSGGGGGGGNIRNITAVYAGDANYAGSTSPNLPITVN